MDNELELKFLMYHMCCVVDYIGKNNIGMCAFKYNSFEVCYN
jgi:hypothetical protein